MQSFHMSLISTCIRKTVTKTRMWTLGMRTGLSLPWVGSEKQRSKSDFCVECWSSLKQELKISKGIFPQRKWTSTVLYGKYMLLIIPNSWWWCPLRPRRANWTKPTVLFCCSYVSWQEGAGIPAYLGEPRKTAQHKQGQSFQLPVLTCCQAIWYTLQGLLQNTAFLSSYFPFLLAIEI